MLRQIGDHRTPCAGDRVRFTYPDGQTLQGVWTFTGGNAEHGHFAVRGDDGQLHTPPPGHLHCDVAKDHVALLTVGEVMTITTLLSEFAAMCPGHPLRELADEHLARIEQRFHFAQANRIPSELPRRAEARAEATAEGAQSTDLPAVPAPTRLSA
ncbi:hypothetical protein [Kineococcus xinjiangensis]|nr:hypothetical protein [Kineococcus xinjiangensis]